MILWINSLYFFKLLAQNMRKFLKQYFKFPSKLIKTPGKYVTQSLLLYNKLGIKLLKHVKQHCKTFNFFNIKISMEACMFPTR